ncbi:unnamed protein product, partial [Rotaria sp. Silwood1]
TPSLVQRTNTTNSVWSSASVQETSRTNSDIQPTLLIVQGTDIGNSPSSSASVQQTDRTNEPTQLTPSERPGNGSSIVSQVTEAVFENNSSYNKTSQENVPGSSSQLESGTSFFDDRT